MASKVLPSGLSNLEWFFLTSRYHACVLLCLEDVMDEDGARAIARRFDGLVVRPFCARTGMALDGAAMADNIMLVNSSEPVGLEQALSDCARWFADRQERSTPLAGLYCVGSGSEGLADRLSAPACRSVAIMVATHALIDGLSLPKVDLEAGPAASGGGETTSEQAVTLPLPARLRAWMDGAITAGTDVLRAAVSRPGAGHFVGIVADADRDRVGAAARLLGVSSEALCYALALAPLFASGAPRTLEMAFRAGAVRLGFEPSLRLAFAGFHVGGGGEIVQLARELETRIAAVRAKRDIKVVSMQAAIGISRSIFQHLPLRLQHGLMDRFFAARTVLSFYPLRAASLLPQDTKLATATAFSLLPSGITVVIQVLPATIRFSVTLESETAERLGPLDDAIARGLAQAEKPA